MIVDKKEIHRDLVKLKNIETFHFSPSNIAQISRCKRCI